MGLEKNERSYSDMSFRIVPEGEAARLIFTCDWTEGNVGYEHAKATYPESDYMDAIKNFAESR